MNTKQSNRGKTLAVIGAFLQLGPLVAVAGTVISMTRAIMTVQSSTPEHLSAQIGAMFTTTAIGLGIGLLGLVLIAIALFAYRYRAPWVFWLLVIYGAISLLGFPLGTIFGIIILGLCFTYRRQFLVQPANPTERIA